MLVIELYAEGDRMRLHYRDEKRYGVSRIMKGRDAISYIKELDRQLGPDEIQIVPGTRRWLSGDKPYSPAGVEAFKVFADRAIPDKILS